MAKSISQAQAEALADGFLNTLGTDRSGLTPTKSVSALIVLAGDLVTKAQENLVQADRVSSGKLSESMKVVNPEMRSGVIAVDVELLYYYKFLDAGVKGTKSGTSSKGYSFKYDNPGGKLQREIRKWIIREGLKHRVDKYNVTNREVRRASFHKSITDIQGITNSLAFIIGRSIKQKGLKRTNFFSKAVSSTKTKAREQFSKAFKIDVINSLPKQLKDA